ncbi:transporter substrate-binding domain-containing protein [Caballeronia sp. HLA56]
MRNVTSIASFKAAVLLAATLGAGAASAAGTVHYGLEAQYAPFEFKSASGELQGLDVDIGNAVYAELKMKCEWTESSFDGIIPALQARKFDVINSAMNVTEKRRQIIDFTNIIYKVPTQLVAKAGIGLMPTPESLKGKNIGVLQGSTQETYAKAKWANNGVTVTTYQDQNQIYTDLKSGRIDGTLVLSAAGQSGFLSKPDGAGYAFAGGPVNDDAILGSGIAFGVRKDDGALKERLNKAIAKLQANGTVKTLARKYLGDIDVSPK